MAAIAFAGRLGATPETKYTANGTMLIALVVPVDTGWGDRKVTTWYRITAWGKLAERLDSTHQKGYLDKGTNVFVRGVFSVREYDKQDGSRGFSADVNADDVTIIFAPKAQASDTFPTYSDDEEVPF